MAERPTPYSVAVCTLIALQSDPTSPLYQEINPSAEVSQRLSAFLQECVLMDSRSTSTGSNATTAMADGGASLVHDMTLSRFLSQLKYVAGEEMQNLVSDYITMAAASVDSLMDLMDSLRRAITEGIVDGASAHGVFLRKVCLGFDQLSFETTALLWSDLCEEMKSVQLTSQSLTEAEAATGTVTNDSNNNNSNSEMRWPLSATQIERALRKKCFRLDDIHSVQEGESFEEMEFNLQQVLAHDPELPAAHFLRFLNCVKHGERVGALDALHQYFDYAIIKGTQEKSQDILQFATILLASLHNSFGDNALAQMATDEAIRVAQQSMDAACVAFALGWIFSNEQNNGGGGSSAAAFGRANLASLDAGDLLKRCAVRASEGRLRPLAAGASLSLSRFLLSQGGAVSGTATTNAGSDEIHHSRGLATLAWSSLMDASSDRANAEADDGAIDRPTTMTDIDNSREIMDTLARQSLVASGIWDYFGQTHLSGISSFLALYCHADQMLSHDVVTAIQNIARVSLHGSPSVLLSRDFDGSVLEKHLEELEQKSVSEKSNCADCVYAVALSKLTSLWKLFRLPMDGVFLLGVTMVLHEWAIRRGEIQQAVAFGVALESYLHPRISNYTQVMIDVFSQKSLLLSRQGKFAEAKQIINDMIEFAKEHQLRTHHASLLLQLSLIQLESNPHLFTAAMPSLLECLSMTEKYEMDGLHATALSVLAQVHLRMRNPKRAIAVLQAALPSLLQREHVWFQADAYLTLAKCHLQLAKTVNEKSEVKAKTTKSQHTRNPALVSLLRSAANDLKKSQTFFLRCQDCIKLREVFYLQARVYDSIPGDQPQRDKASECFLKISEHLAASDEPQPDNKGVMNCLSTMETLEKMAKREVPLVAV